MSEDKTYHYVKWIVIGFVVGIVFGWFASIAMGLEWGSVTGGFFIFPGAIGGSFFGFVVGLITPYPLKTSSALKYPCFSDFTE